MQLRRGRMVRLRQCLSYAALLGSAVTDYRENLLEKNPSIADIIRNYDELEAPGKIEALIPLVQELLEQGEKLVIWSKLYTYSRADP